MNLEERFRKLSEDINDKYVRGGDEFRDKLWAEISLDVDILKGAEINLSEAYCAFLATYYYFNKPKNHQQKL